MKKPLIVIIILVVVALGGWLVVSKAPFGGGGKSAQNEAPKPLATVSYACNEGKTITAEIYAGTSSPATPAGAPPAPSGTAKVVLDDGRTLTLAQTISADGARYANKDETFVFWSKGNGALVLESGQEKGYTGCIELSQGQAGSNLAKAYANSAMGFSIKLPSLVSSSTEANPDSFTLDESYQYHFSPSKSIGGVKFTIPASMATGTNLSNDSYIAVEELPRAKACTGDIFLSDPAARSASTTDGQVTYSVASSTGAAAGNRYEETIYALPGTSPCVALRYFIHYGVIENYPEGSVREFDKAALLDQFDAIRRSLVVSR